MRGKNAIITGARGGIGRATLELFAENGVNVWACLRQPDEEFEQAVASLEKKHGVWIKPVFFDLSNEEEVKASFRDILAEKKPLDILVNNAGIVHGALLSMTTMSTLHEIFQVNFFSQVLLLQLAARLMLKQKNGAIINIVSVAGLDAEAGATAYGSSKTALAFATRTVSRELAPQGVRVNAVAPGLVRTKMMDLMEDKAKTRILSGSSLGRVAEPREIAEAILFLASDRASFITGQVLRVDGGL